MDIPFTICRTRGTTLNSIYIKNVLDVPKHLYALNQAFLNVQHVYLPKINEPKNNKANSYLIFIYQQNDIEAAREAYDAFLAHYPYCYGYWRKYADYEKRKGNKKKCEDVS